MDYAKEAVSRPFQGNSIGAMAGARVAASLGQTTAIQNTPDESPSKIRDAVNFTEQLVGDLLGILSHLESRLDPALTPSAPTPAPTDARAGTNAIASHLLTRVATVNEGLQIAISRVASLRQRVEV